MDLEIMETLDRPSLRPQAPPPWAGAETVGGKSQRLRVGGGITCVFAEKVR